MARLEHVDERKKRISEIEKYGDLAAAQYNLTMLKRQEIRLLNPKSWCALQNKVERSQVEEEVSNNNEAERCEQNLEDNATSRWLQALPRARTIREEESMTSAWDREMEQLRTALFAALQHDSTHDKNTIEGYLRACKSTAAPQQVGRK